MPGDVLLEYFELLQSIAEKLGEDCDLTKFAIELVEGINDSEKLRDELFVLKVWDAHNPANAIDDYILGKDIAPKIYIHADKFQNATFSVDIASDDDNNSKPENKYNVN